LKFDILSYLSSGYRATTTAFCSARRVCVCVCVCVNNNRVSSSEWKEIAKGAAIPWQQRRDVLSCSLP